MWYNMPMEKFDKRSGGIGKSPEAFYYQIIINYNKRGVLMAEKISKLIEEYRSTKECLECGLKWLPTNDVAKSKIDVINMVIRDLEQLESQYK